MNYREERERIERDRMALRVWQSEFRPELIRKIESHKAMLNLSKTPSEADLKESQAYNAGKLKRLLDPKFHVIAKLTILPSEIIFSQYIAVLSTANALSEDIKRNPGEGFWSKLFGGRKKDLAKLDKSLEEIELQAQGLISEFIQLHS